MQKKRLLILGAGGYGQLARETAEAMELFDKIAFLDDNSPRALGKCAEYLRFREEYDCAFVAMGAPALRERWIDALEEAGFSLPPLIHPRAYVSPSAVLDEATIVEAMAVVNTAATVARGGLICAGSVVNHNAQVLPYCQIDCNAVVAADATVPKGTKVSAGTVYYQTKNGDK